MSDVIGDPINHHWGTAFPVKFQIVLSKEEVHNLKRARMDSEVAYLELLGQIFNDPATGPWEVFYDAVDTLIPERPTVLDLLIE